MFRLIIFKVLLVFVVGNFNAQCNGQSEVCGKRYDEVAFLTTHNSYNTGSEGFSFPNHNYGVAQQLQDGVRAFMLDVYSLFGDVVQYHGTFTLGYQSLQDDLVEIAAFLDANPSEVVTLILECNVSSIDIENELITTGLYGYLFAKIDGQPWPTIQEMIDDNKRLVILSDENDAMPGQVWYHYVWDHAVETHYSVNSPQDFTDEYNRGDSLNDLFIFNHFVTDATIGVGSESDAQTVNDYTFLMNRVTNHFNNYQKFPNFITLDFYEHGDGLQVVHDLNAGFLSTPELAGDHINVYPNPVAGRMIVEMTNKELLKSVRVYNSQSEIVSQGVEASVDMTQLSSGVYLVEVETNTGVYRTKVIRY